MQIEFTGHPVVDYGLVSLRSLAGSSGDLADAVRQLGDLLTADLDGTAREYTAYLPNSVFSNPSTRATRQQDILAFLETLQLLAGKRGSGDFVCNLCGHACPEGALLHARKDRVPFLLGDANFYPLLAPGLAICGQCALAVVAALPAMTRAGGDFLFVHVQDERAAEGLVKQALDTVRASVLAGSFQLHAHPEVASPEAALVRNLYDLLTRNYAQYLQLECSLYPKTLWAIRSGNRPDDVRLRYISIPHTVLVFLDRLVTYEQQANIFPSFLEQFYGRRREMNHMLRGQTISCLKQDGTPNGAWYGHRIYLQEVTQMDPAQIATIERIGIAIASSERAPRYLERLRQDSGHRTLALILHELVACGALQKEDARILVTYDNPLPLADALRAVTYDYQRCVQQQVPFPHFTGEPISPTQMVETIERVAERVAQRHQNLRSVLVSLIRENSPKSIRRTYVRWVSYGWMSWQEFLALCPISEEREDQQRMWKYRDFLAACLAWHARQRGVDTTIAEEETP